MSYYRNKNLPYRLTQLIAILILSSHSLFSQNSVVSSGGNGEGIGGTVSFSIGQTTFNTFVSDSGSVSEGIQHAYEVLVVSVSDIIAGEFLKLNIFPNPFDTYLVLLVDNELIRNLRYELFNSDGKLLYSNQVSAPETRIEVNNLSSGIYILRVYNESSNLKTFKVIKR